MVEVPSVYMHLDLSIIWKADDLEHCYCEPAENCSSSEFNIPIHSKKMKNMRLNSCQSIFFVCMETAIS